MLLGRRAGARALTRSKVGINPSQQVRFLTSEKPSLRVSVENNTRVNTILRVQKAVASTSSKLTLDGLTTDDQRRDYLWSRKEQLLKILPGREWKKVYAITRRLFEFNLLARPPAEKEFKKKLLENSGELLVKLEQIPMWLDAEIKTLQKTDQVNGEGKETNSESLTEKTDPAADDTGAVKEESSKENKTGSMIEAKRIDNVYLSIANQALQEMDAKMDVKMEDISWYRSTLPSSDSDSAVAAKAATKTSSKPAVKSAERFLEKKALESEKDIRPIQIVFPDYEKLIRPNNKEEQLTVEKLEQLKTPEDTQEETFRILQKLSRTLLAANVSPDLKPVVYTNQTSYALLSEATVLLEEACFLYVRQNAPSIVTWPKWDCPEAQEYKRWVELIIRLGKEHSKDGFKLPPKFYEGIGYGDIIRNSAAHRLPIHAPKLRELLRRARMWVETLEVPETARKFERLEQIAAEMQTELESAYSPVVLEIRRILARIKSRWDEVGRLEQEIFRIRGKIRDEMAGIETEEQNMEGSLRMAESVRYDLGQNFERESFRDYIHGTDAERNEPMLEEDFSEERGEVWSSTAAEKESSMSAKSISEEASSEEDTTKIKVRKMAGTETISRNQNHQAMKIALSLEQADETSTVQNNEFSKADRTKLVRDYEGGLVAFERDVLLDINEISAADSQKLEKDAKKSSETRVTKRDANISDSKANALTATEMKELSEDKQAPKDKKVANEESSGSPAGEDKPQKLEGGQDLRFEGSNLSRDSDMTSLRRESPKWYNPLSWFK